MPKSRISKTLHKSFISIPPKIEKGISVLSKITKKDRAYKDKSNTYNSLKNRLETDGYFKSLVSINKNYTALDTAKRISFKSSIQFGSSKRDVKKRLGIPLVEIKNSLEKDHEVLLYKLFVGPYRATCEFHFFKGLFLVGSYTLNNQVNFQILKKSLEKKYTKGSTINLSDTVYLNDPDGNTLTIHSAPFSICLVYVNRLNREFAEMTKQLKKVSLKSKDKNSRQLITTEDL